jgi:hypothetical protein
LVSLAPPTAIESWKVRALRVTFRVKAPVALVTAAQQEFPLGVRKLTIPRAHATTDRHLLVGIR